MMRATEETIMPGGLDPYAAVTTASRGTLDSVNVANIHGTQMIQPVRKNDDAAAAAAMEKIGAQPGAWSGRFTRLGTPGSARPRLGSGRTHGWGAGTHSYRPARFTNGCAREVVEPVEAKVVLSGGRLLHPAKQPSEQNSRMPLTCKEHSGALVVLYGGVPSRECQACRTFHPITAFGRDNKTCETRLLRKKLRYRAKAMQRRGVHPENLAHPAGAYPHPAGAYPHPAAVPGHVGVQPGAQFGGAVPLGAVGGLGGVPQASHSLQASLLLTPRRTRRLFSSRRRRNSGISISPGSMPSGPSARPVSILATLGI